jgi:hypothetical protein
MPEASWRTSHHVDRHMIMPLDSIRVFTVRQSKNRHAGDLTEHAWYFFRKVGYSDYDLWSKMLQTRFSILLNVQQMWSMTDRSVCCRRTGGYGLIENQRTLAVGRAAPSSWASQETRAAVSIRELGSTHYTVRRARFESHQPHSPNHALEVF